ncbi:helix-turn-helix domain-containing protein [Microbacterium sp. ZW T5_45]|uniref:helix-turn-helix domain-containing protein n=1 Tax=Microbacterium sp. ZW T5_45 TaxID=3378080 RepID=UPI0038528B94
MSRPEGFAAVPNWMIRDESIDGYEIAVYTALASHTGPGGIRPSQATLAREARCSERKVRDTLQKLIDRGVIEVIRRRRRGSGAGRHGALTDGYRLLPHGPLADTEFAEADEPASGAGRSGDQPAPDDRPTGTGVQSLLSIEEEPVEEETSDVARDALPARAESKVDELCALLAELVVANGHKVGKVGQTWRAACERLIRLDGYSVEQIEWMIRWSTSHEFWAANIRSMPTLREKFSTLVLQAKRDASRHQAQSPTARANSVMEMGRRLAEAGVTR